MGARVLLAGPAALAEDRFVDTPMVTVASNLDVGNSLHDQTVMVDFTESSDTLQNPAMYHGYVIVHGDGTVSCGPSGGPRNEDGTPSGGAYRDDGTCQPS